jgi:DNA-directed RNA polymerase specialized sigma24 family protein
MGREGSPDDREFDALFEAHYQDLRRYVMRRIETVAGPGQISRVTNPGQGGG